MKKKLSLTLLTALGTQTMCMEVHDEWKKYSAENGVTLTLATVEDLDDIERTSNDPQVAKFLSGPENTGRISRERKIKRRENDCERLEHNNEREADWHFWVVRDQRNNYAGYVSTMVMPTEDAKLFGLETSVVGKTDQGYFLRDMKYVNLSVALLPKYWGKLLKDAPAKSFLDSLVTCGVSGLKEKKELMVASNAEDVRANWAAKRTGFKLAHVQKVAVNNLPSWDASVYTWQ